MLVKDFQVKFETGPVQTGAARLFRADLDVTDAPGDPTKPTVLEVNHPLHVDGSTVHLIGHGYAPIVTVKDGQGNVAFSGPVVFLPQDGNFTSAGVVKVPDARPQRLALQGFFLPSTVQGANQAPVSAFPDALNPALFVNVWSGPPAKETGKAENIYSLDTTGLTQVKGDDGAPLRVALPARPGRRPARRARLGPARRLEPLGQAAGGGLPGGSAGPGLDRLRRARPVPVALRPAASRLGAARGANRW